MVIALSYKFSTCRKEKNLITSQPDKRLPLHPLNTVLLHECSENYLCSIKSLFLNSSFTWVKRWK